MQNKYNPKNMKEKSRNRYIYHLTVKVLIQRGLIKEFKFR